MVNRREAIKAIVAAVLAGNYLLRAPDDSTEELVMPVEIPAVALIGPEEAVRERVAAIIAVARLEVGPAWRWIELMGRDDEFGYVVRQIHERGYTSAYQAFLCSPASYVHGTDENALASAMAISRRLNQAREITWEVRA